MDFETLLAQLMNPGEDGLPDSIYDDLSASYTEATSTRDAKLSQTTESLTALQAELTATKAANWDLMQMIPQAPNESPVDNPDDTGDNDSEPDDIGDDDDFFEDKDNK